MTFLSKKFVDWLRYASITQGGGASSGGFFTGPRSRQVSWICMFSSSSVTFLLIVCARLVRQPPPITELDGTVSGDFFTVLCVGQGFTEDQWMNVYSFSMLRHWLLTYHSVSNGNSTVDTGKAAPRLMSRLLDVRATNECQPQPLLLFFSPSSPVSRLQHSLSHSFSNGKTCEQVESLCCLRAQQIRSLLSIFLTAGCETSAHSTLHDIASQPHVV